MGRRLMKNGLSPLISSIISLLTGNVKFLIRL